MLLQTNQPIRLQYSHQIKLFGVKQQLFTQFNVSIVSSNYEIIIYGGKFQTNTYPNDNGPWFSIQKGYMRTNARFPYQMMFISLTINTMGVTSRAETAYPLS